MEQGVSPFSEGGSLRFCLVYPNTYAVGSCNLGFATLFRMLNEADDCTAERLFALDDKRRVLGAPRAIETKRPLEEFAVIALSFMSELDYLNGAALLEEAGIPWRREDRGGDGPLVMAGGAAVTLNPAPISAMADIVIRGEWESDGPTITKSMVKGWQDSQVEGVLEALGSFPGAVDLDGALLLTTKPAIEPMAHLSLIPEKGVFAKMALVEATRGCPWSCRFCSARCLYSPYRVARAEDIIDYARQMKPYSNRVGLVGAGLAARKDLVEILVKLGEEEIQASLASLRLDGVNEDLLHQLKEHGQRTITLAPESFRPETLATLGKREPVGGFLANLEKVLKAGFHRVKLYMMMAIPGDSPDESVERAHETLSALGKLAKRIELAYAVFQPKPATAMAKEKISDNKAIKKELKLIKKRLGPLVGTLELPGPKGALIADLLCRGDSTAIELALSTRPKLEDCERAISAGQKWWLPLGGSISELSPSKNI